MAKSITFFDKEHTSGINLAAMEDTQLKENLVQDIATGGTEAPTANAVKEAIDAKMAKADIVNDLTTGGADKVLSAEQGKVLDGKKVDKVVTPASVYVTEGSKLLSDFAMKADIINDLTTGGADKVLSAEQGKTLEGKKVDKVVTPASVYVTEGSKPLSDFAMKADIVNDLTTGGADKVLSAEQGKVLDGKKVDKVVTPASVYVTEGSKPLSEFAMKADIINDLTTGGTDKALSAEQGKVLDGKKVDKIDTPDSVYTTNGSKPLSEFATFAEVTLSGTSGTFISMPNLNGFNKDKGISSSIFFVQRNDLGSIKNTIKKGDIVSFKASGQGVKGNVTAVFSHIVTEPTFKGDNVLNETGNDFNGWYAFTILSSDYDRVQMKNKTQSWTVELEENSETVRSMYSMSDYSAPNSRCVFYVKPGDIASITNLRQGDIVTFLPAPGKGDIVAIYEGLVIGAPTVDKQLCLNKTNPASGNFTGWYIFNVVSSAYDRVHYIVGQRTYSITYTPEDGLILGLRRGYNIILKPNTALTNLLPSLRPGDIVELSNPQKSYVYTTKFRRLCSREDNTPTIRDLYVVGQNTIPADITGWFLFEVIGSITDMSNLPVELTTNRFREGQFAVGSVYRINYELSGNDIMSIPNNPNIGAAKFTANRLAIYEALLGAGSIRLKMEGKYIYLNIIKAEFGTGKFKITGLCIGKGSTEVTDR